MTTTATTPVRYQRGWRKIVYRGLAVGLSVGIACGIAEAALRIAGYGRSYVCPFGAFHQADPILGWRGKPNFTGRWRQGDFDVCIAQNEDGFRKLEYRKEPSQAESTVYVLGDSFVWGYGTAQGKNFTDRLNLLLPKRQVENFGLAGSGTVQQHMVFKTYVRPRLRRGDTVLIAFFGNDFYDNVGRILEGALHAEVQGGEIHVVWPDGSNTQGELINKLKDWSCLINLVAYCADRYHNRRVCERMTGRPQTPAAGAPTPQDVADDRPEVLVTRHYLAKFKKACDEQEARLVVAYVPGQAELGEDDCSVTEDLTPPEQATYRKAFFHCADALGIETVDLLPRLLAAKKARRFERVTFCHDFHWNENGHAVAAETIAACLLQRDRADCPQTARRTGVSGVK